MYFSSSLYMIQDDDHPYPLFLCLNVLRVDSNSVLRLPLSSV